MRRATLRSSNLAVALGVASLFAIGYPAEVRAQTKYILSRIFFGCTRFSGKRVVHRWSIYNFRPIRFFCQTGRAPMATRRALFRAPRWPARRLPNIADDDPSDHE